MIHDSQFCYKEIISSCLVPSAKTETQTVASTSYQTGITLYYICCLLGQHSLNYYVT